MEPLEIIRSSKHKTGVYYTSTGTHGSVFIKLKVYIMHNNFPQFITELEERWDDHNFDEKTAVLDYLDQYELRDKILYIQKL